MSKNLKISYILSMIFAGIIMAWGTISNYFSGVGVCFILLVGILTTLLIFLLTDSFVKSRIKDLFIVTCVFVLLEFFCLLFDGIQSFINRCYAWNAEISNVYIYIGIDLFSVRDI